MTRPTALAAMQKKANPAKTDTKSFSAHFEDLEASRVDVSAIINSIGFDCVFLTKKSIELCYKTENKRLVLPSFYTLYKGNLEGKFF